MHYLRISSAYQQGTVERNDTTAPTAVEVNVGIENIVVGGKECGR